MITAAMSRRISRLVRGPVRYRSVWSVAGLNDAVVDEPELLAGTRDRAERRARETDGT